ncbi:hypothetical protein JCM11641_002751 [Rhodosporidiobolus odoratus]
MSSLQVSLHAAPAEEPLDGFVAKEGDMRLVPMEARVLLAKINENLKTLVSLSSPSFKVLEGSYEARFNGLGDDGSESVNLAWQCPSAAELAEWSSGQPQLVETEEEVVRTHKGHPGPHLWEGAGLGTEREKQRVYLPELGHVAVAETSPAP